MSADGRCFSPCGQAEPEARAQGSIAGEGCWVLGNSESGDCYRVRVGNRWVVSVAGDYDMRPAGEDFGGATMVVPKAPARKLFPSRWLPEYVRLPLGTDGRPKLPVYGVATVVEAADKWRELMGPLEKVEDAQIEP